LKGQFNLTTESHLISHTPFLLHVKLHLFSLKPYRSNNFIKFAVQINHQEQKKNYFLRYCRTVLKHCHNWIL